MLRQILERLRTGGTWTVDGLARELGVSPPLVEAAIEDLVGRGYLAPAGGTSQIPCPTGGCTNSACHDSSGGGCTACSAAGSCVRGASHGSEDRRVWTLA